MPKSIVEVAGFSIGGDQTFIIADIGSNHKQDLILAKESIDAAAESGADAVKFQSIQVDRLYHKPDNSTRQFVSQLEFPEEWHYELMQYSKSKGVIFFSSPTYLKAVDLLEEVDVHLYKIASAQIGTFPQLVEKVAALNKPTIISTGISNYEEVSKAIEIFEYQGNNKYIVLHCNSVYPAPPEIVNLSLINTYKSMFGCITGFSDHTNGLHMSLAAVAQGAKVIEKHFTLDRSLDTPDSTSFASDPNEFSSLVNQIREIELGMQRSQLRTRILDEEEEFKSKIIYRLRTLTKIEKGMRLSDGNVEYIRASEGVDARKFYYQGLSSFTLRRSIEANEIIFENDIQFIEN